MGELNNGGVIMNEDCSTQHINPTLLAQQHNNNGSPEQSYSGNEEEEMGEGEMEKRNFGRGSQNENNKTHDLLRQQVSDLTIQMTYLSHQVTLLLNALHVPSCQCGICKPFYQTQVQMFRMLKDSASSAQQSPVEVVDNKPVDVAQNGFIEKTSINLEAPQPSSMGTLSTGNVQTIPNVPLLNDCEALLSQIFTQTGLPFNGVQVAAAAAGLPTTFGFTTTATGGTSYTNRFCANPTNTTHHNTNSSGRRSKYCSAEEKKAVADYAEAHGPSAAARKFGIPTPVAAYYHRKEYKPKPQVAALASQMLPPVSSASPGTTSGDDVDSMNGECQNSAVSNSSKLAGLNGVSQHLEQQLKQNPAHSTGSPGFLRGRGRGRPKLIGDELDAELVDYMVQIKKSDPRGHLTASQALTIARDYIMEKAPGLLEEHGGQIKLKLTWAMKLVARISERQKELEFGLPPGSLSNMTKNMSNSAVPGGNFMADMVAQNLLSQQMTQIMHQAISGSGTAAASATPQILNVRELELPKPDDGDLKGEIINGVENAIKDEDMDVGEQQFDVDIENQADDVGSQSTRNSSSIQQHFIPTNAF